jgi:hypothetical protein
LAPIPSASVRTTTAEKPGRIENDRNATRASISTPLISSRMRSETPATTTSLPP